MAKCKDCEYYMKSGLCEYNECYCRADFNSCDAYTGKGKPEDQKTASIENVEHKDVVSLDRLLGLTVAMEHKAKHIKTRFEPEVFEDVVKCLKELRQRRKEEDCK